MDLRHNNDACKNDRGMMPKGQPIGNIALSAFYNAGATEVICPVGFAVPLGYLGYPRYNCPW